MYTKRIPCENEDRDRGDVSVKENQKLPANHQKLGSMNTVSFIDLRGTQPLIPWSQASRLQTLEFLLFKPPNLWCFVTAAPANNCPHIGVIDYQGRFTPLS